MIPAIASDGTLTEWKSNLTATARRHKKSSLGDLAGTFLEGSFPEVGDSSNDAGKLTPEISFRISLQVGTSPESEADQRSAILKLVVERNRLIHRDALTIDLNPPEECALLSARLDEQN